MSLEHRPTFAAEVDASLETVNVRLRDGLEASPVEARFARTPNARQDAEAAVNATHLVVTFREAHRHFWSPWLMLDLEARRAEAGSTTHLFGRFSPHPAVWTAYLFAYLGTSVLAFISLIFAYSQWSLGHTPSGIWGVSVCAAVAAGLWWSSQVGKRLARQQMIELRALVEAAVHSPPDR